MLLRRAKPRLIDPRLGWRLYRVEACVEKLEKRIKQLEAELEKHFGQLEEEAREETQASS